MDDWKLKKKPVVRLQRPMYVYILLLGKKITVGLVLVSAPFFYHSTVGILLLR